MWTDVPGNRATAGFVGSPPIVEGFDTIGAAMRKNGRQAGLAAEYRLSRDQNYLFGLPSHHNVVNASYLQALVTISSMFVDNLKRLLILTMAEVNGLFGCGRLATNDS